MDKLFKAVDGQDLLGESPVWCPREQALYWVDSRAPAVRRFDYASGMVESWKTPEVVGSFALRESGGFLVAMQTCIAFLDPKTGAVEKVVAPEAPHEDRRFNDGKCDPRGRFWVGTKYGDYKKNQGSLFRLDPDRSIKVMDTNILSTNGLAWSPDHKIMYFADSALDTIFAYPYDIDTGDIGPRKAIAKTDVMPDGSTVDAEGFIWSAGYKGWRVTRYAPDGRVDRVIEVPVAQPTSCAFGGPDLDILYITTARQRISDEDLAKQPWAGSVLGIKPGVKGLPEPRFAG